MINEPNILHFKISPVLSHHTWVSTFAKVVRAIAIIIFLTPFVFRMLGDISLDMYFLMFFGCWGASIFLFLGAEILDALTEPGHIDL
ncbi:hypothetical protein [Echinicola shivajiensis]|uniref:hypothetical protein n=1 Tax=Echinicola shivajiensis TaxID=1035916 RepID=UPI001BFC8E73|nr:hypothetical protein [Echinicola shivajiensis]